MPPFWIGAAAPLPDLDPTLRWSNSHSQTLSLTSAYITTHKLYWLVDKLYWGSGMFACWTAEETETFKR